METELDRRKVALQNDVAKLIAQGWTVTNTNETAVTLVMRKRNAGRTFAMIVFVPFGLLAVIISGFIIPIIGWFLAGLGFMGALGAIGLIGVQHLTLTIYDYAYRESSPSPMPPPLQLTPEDLK
jgi:hypothetical protein